MTRAVFRSRQKQGWSARGSVRRTCGALAAAACLTAAVPSRADGEDRRGLFIELGVFLPLDLEASLDISIPSFGLKGEVDLEQDLSFPDEENIARLRGGYRFSRRHEIEFSYLSVSRRIDRVYEELLEILGVTFPAGLDLLVAFEALDFQLGYKYFLVQRSKAELGLSGGLHGVYAELEVRADLRPNLDLFFAESDQLQLPLPYLGVDFDAEPVNKLHLGARLKVLEIEIWDFSGSLVTFEATLEHRTFRHVGFGIGFYLGDLDASLEPTTDLTVVGLKRKQSGFQLFLRISQ